MRLSRSTWVRALVTVAWLTGSAVSDVGAQPRGLPCPASQAEIETIRSLLTRWIDHRMALSAQPGLAIALVCGTETVWAKGFGLAELDRGTPVDAATPFRISSITKLFTATAVLRLRDAGALALSDPVSAHLPGFDLGNGGITIENLLTHTAGLPTNSPRTDFTSMIGPDPVWRPWPSEEDGLEALRPSDLVHPPGTRWKYSNLGFALLGEVIEAASDRSYDRYVREAVLEPLGMEDTRVRPGPDDPVATGYGPRRPGRPRRVAPRADLMVATPAGGMASTAEDMARFLAFQIDPSSHPEVLAPSTVREIQRVHRWVDPERAGSGLAWAVDRRGDRRIVYHGGELPSQTAHLRVDLDAGIGAAVLANAEDADPHVFALEAEAWLLRAVDSESGEAADRGSSLLPYAGRFCWGDRERWTVAIGGRLLLVDPLAERPSATAVALAPMGSGSFRVEAGWAVGEIARIDLGDDGRPARLRLPNLSYGALPEGRTRCPAYRFPGEARYGTSTRPASGSVRPVGSFRRDRESETGSERSTGRTSTP